MIEVFRFPKSRIIRGAFLERLNRFAGRVLIDGVEELVHIHDPGRIPLLRDGRSVLLLRIPKGDLQKRKTKYDLLAFWNRNEWIFSHSGFHSQIFENILRKNILWFRGELRKEVRVRDSRIDFMVNSSLIEVKGCTWIRNNCCYFSDAPTSRGRRHLRELARYVKSHGRAYIVFLAFSLHGRCIRLARDVDRVFYEEALSARRSGVRFLGLRLVFDGEKIYYVDLIPVLF